MQFDFTLAGYGSQAIETAGRFVKYVSGVGKIRVRFDKGGYIDLLPGQGCNGLDFSRLTIEDRSGTGNVGVLLAGAFAFQDDRITGTVDVVDGGKDRTRAGQTFLIYSAAYSGVVGNCPIIQIENPAGSGRDVYLKSLMLSSANACFIGMGVNNSALGTFGSIAQPKQLGGAAGVTKLYYKTLPAGTYATSQNILGSNVQTRGAVVWAMAEPIWIKPGQSLAIGADDQAAGSLMTISGEVLELPL